MKKILIVSLLTLACTNVFAQALKSTITRSDAVTQTFLLGNQDVISVTNDQTGGAYPKIFVEAEKYVDGNIADPIIVECAGNQTQVDPGSAVICALGAGQVMRIFDNSFRNGAAGSYTILSAK